MPNTKNQKPAEELENAAAEEAAEAVAVDADDDTDERAVETTVGPRLSKKLARHAARALIRDLVHESIAAGTFLAPLGEHLSMRDATRIVTVAEATADLLDEWSRGVVIVAVDAPPAPEPEVVDEAAEEMSPVGRVSAGLVSC